MHIFFFSIGHTSLKSLLFSCGKYLFYVYELFISYNRIVEVNIFA